MRIQYLFVAVFLLSVLSFSQNDISLTGSLSVDSKLIQIGYNEIPVKQITFESNSKKSPYIAGILSAIMPGAGEVYVGGTTNYIKAGALLLIEATAIYYDISYNKRGDAQTNYFQNLADQHWSVVKYAEWINANTSGPKVPIDPNTSLPPWKRVNWTALNVAEDSIGAVGFTHHLPIHGYQQYYELIGKYPQYARGWDDYVSTSNPDYHSPLFDFYSKARGDANDLYKIASRGAAFIYVNHLLSLIDAVWSAVSFNKDIALNFRYEPVDLVYEIDYVPTVHLQYSF
jgi:hypothetical protein